jgi:hypothetical protein
MKGIFYLTRAQLPSSIKQAGIEFEILAPYSGCFICGEVYQSSHDLLFLQQSEDPFTPLHVLHETKTKADRARALWRVLHSEGHRRSEHEALKNSPDLMTVEAAIKLVPLGIIPLEHSQEFGEAMREIPRVSDVSITRGG